MEFERGTRASVGKFPPWGLSMDCMPAFTQVSHNDVKQYDCILLNTKGFLNAFMGITSRNDITHVAHVLNEM